MPRGIPLNEAQLLDIKAGLGAGETCASIARHLGLSAEGVRQVGIRFPNEIADLRRQNYEELAALYEGKAREMAEGITPEKIAESKARDLAVGSAVMLDKSLLLRGQPTERHEVSLAEIDRELAMYLHEARERGLNVRDMLDVEDAELIELLDEVEPQALPGGDSAASKADAQESE